MKIQFDTYTKAVLTIICLCLLWLSVKDVCILRQVQAAGPMEVVVGGTLNLETMKLVDVRVSGFGANYSFPVEVRGTIKGR